MKLSEKSQNRICIPMRLFKKSQNYFCVATLCQSFLPIRLVPLRKLNTQIVNHF